MSEALDELVASFVPIEDAAATSLLSSLWGVPSPSLTRLESERDDTFRVRSDAGEFVLKVAHPSDDPLAINLQTAAMSFAGEVDPGIPLQRILPTIDGELEPLLETEDGERVMRVLTWLPGETLDHHELTADRLSRFGAMIGRLAAALEDFRHPAADRELAWDVENLPALRELLELAPELEGPLDRFAALSDEVAALAHQVVHNDLNHHNVVADPAADEFVTGIIDFGDAGRTARAIDLAVAASYVLDPAVGWESVAPIVAGYERVNPLTAAERALLPDLVAARLVQRVLLGHFVAREKGALSTLRGLDRSRAQLDSLQLQ